jgi:purine-nucleoside phosphorylase
MTFPTDPAGLPREAFTAADHVRRRWREEPRVGLVLGTGLGGLSRWIETHVAIAYTELPGFPRSTALGHRGQLVCGRLADQNVIALNGRCHAYEGYSVSQLMLPVYTFWVLGVRRLILSNAGGGLNPKFESGDLVVIDDHINLMFWARSPRQTRTRGPGRDESPVAAALATPAIRPSRTAANGQTAASYDPVLIEQALWVARRDDFAAHRGVYVAMTGPNYETRAEYRFLRRIGGDIVGMSTVPEVVAAAACGMKTLALSVVTNVARPDHPNIVLAEDVVRAAETAEAHVRQIVLDVIAEPWESVEPPARGVSGT